MKTRIIILLAALLGGQIQIPLHAAPGDVDLSFDPGSFGANVDQAVLSLAVQADGKVLIGGFFNTPRQWFARLNPDGSSDYSFNPTWQGGSVYAVALQNDGKIYVGGQGSTRLVRLNPDGSADPSFTTTWPAQDGVVWCVLPLPDGRVFLSGGFTAINQTARAFVARLAGDYSPAMILQDPVSQTAESGSQVVFKVRASGAPPLSYQWCFQGSAPITGASTAAGYCITNVQAAHSGAYTVIVSNLCGAVTSAPAFLNVISPVERRPVPRIRLAGQPGLRVALSYATALTAPLVWIPLDQVVLTNTPQSYFDLTSADGLPRFYRAAHTNSPAPPVGLDLRLVPQVTLNGPIGSSVRVDCINQFGPIDAWVTLDTVSLATQPQYYYDVTAPDNPPRLYRLVSMP